MQITTEDILQNNLNNTSKINCIDVILTTRKNKLIGDEFNLKKKMINFKSYKTSVNFIWVEIQIKHANLIFKVE